MNKKLIGYIIVLLLTIPAILSLLKPGFFGASDDMHIAWLQQMDQSIKEGQIPPRYVADLSYGFGYPLFNFIFPLPYYLGVLFHFTGLSYVYSIKAVFLLGMMVSAITMFVLIKYLSGTLVGIAGAVLYTYSPYRSTDVYVRGAVGESLSFIFLPLIIYCLIRLYKSEDKYNYLKWIGFGSLSIAGLILSHNIVSYMFLPFAILLGLLLFKNKVLKFLLMFVGGMLASIYFWLPALIDSRLMKYETVFNYFDHFPTLKQLFTPYWGYGASVPGNYDLMSFFIGEINLIIMVISLFCLILNYKKMSVFVKKIILWSLVLIIVSVVMMNYRSSFVWEIVPLIKYFQFPWRFLTMVIFGSSIMVAGLKYFKYSKIIALLVIVVSIGLNMNRFRPHDYLLRDDQYYLNRYIPIPKPSEDYKNLKEEYLRLPLTTDIRPTENKPRIFPNSGQIRELKILNSTNAKFLIDSETDLLLNYNKYYFPGWEGTIDDEKLSLTPGKPYGQIQFKVDAGIHEVTIGFKETFRNRMLNLISVLAIGLSLCLMMKKITLTKHRNQMLTNKIC